MLQEVKRTGIEILLKELKDKLYVHPGPRIKCGTSKGAETEFYPLIMRLERQSLLHHPYTFDVKRVWWITKDKAIGEMQVADLPIASSSKPHLTWNKHKDSFRPVVVYDLKIGDAPGVIHIGVVHTTPGTQIKGLTGPEKRSTETMKKLAAQVLGRGAAKRKTGGRRKPRQKAVADSEFHRLAEFRQVDDVLKEVNAKSYTADEDYAGPWVLGGDYYLFAESTVVDLAAAYYSMQEDDRKKLNALIDEEFSDRLQRYRACEKTGAELKRRSAFWKELSAECAQYEKKSLFPRERSRSPKKP